ncbi:hypothetical protein AB1Y20_019929 [Prymnesium parvum]|uniref:Tudor domain-containing protein n=1 Tax=Prymnesium parvum TaxID=97485 RepID=A0AB34JVS7_PRYPA
MAALCLLGSLATALLPSNSIGHRPPTSGTRLRSLQTILMCDLAGSEQPPALLSGRRVVEGDLLVHKDAESQAWWRAVAREVVGNRVLVHYAGCDPYWDAWVDIDEMTLMHMDSNERAKEAGAFQSEEYESSMDDEAVLKEMRKKRWEDNARWQINVFARSQLGVFDGTSVEYVQTVRDDGSLRFSKEESSSSCSADVLDGSASLFMVDKMRTPSLGIDLQADYRAFTPEMGNMAVANAYTLAQADADGSILLELALKEGTRRVRCKLLYNSGDSGERQLERLAVVKEAAEGSTFAQGDDMGTVDLDGSPGRGLYNPPSGMHDGSVYTTLYCDGGVTLKFPRAIPLNVPGCISLDWVAGKMRYQLDRKFSAMDGSLASLELTEISKEDSMIYPPSSKS